MSCSNSCYACRQLRLIRLNIISLQSLNRASSFSAAAKPSRSSDKIRRILGATTAPSSVDQQIRRPVSSNKLCSAEDQNLLRIFRSNGGDKTSDSSTKGVVAENEDQTSVRSSFRLGGREPGHNDILDTSLVQDSPPVPVARVVGKYGRRLRNQSDLPVSNTTPVSCGLPANENSHQTLLKSLHKDAESVLHKSNANRPSAPAPQSKRNIGLSDELLDAFKSDVGKAVERCDASRMESIWAEVQGNLNEDIALKENMGLLTNLYSHVLWGFTSIHRPNRAIQIWNEMVTKRVIPTLPMWDTMLDGFGAVRNTKAVEGIWKMMLESGCNPDKRLWVTRIRALATSGSWRSSFHAFEDMAMTWLREARKTTHGNADPNLATMGDIGDVPKPSVEALNGLINGLVQARRETHSALKKLPVALSWSQVLGLSMDTYTFNPMIRLALKDGNMELAQMILEEMQRLGVKKDVATYTIMVQSVFQRGAHLAYSADPSTQSAIASPNSAGSFQRKIEDISQVIQDAEESGVTPNAYTFSAMVSGLLKDVGNIQAAEGLCKVMTVRGIPMSSQIYTSFITAYFELPSGPDLRRVVMTWEQARADESTILDSIFYDRLVEGFARCGEVAKMRVALAQMGKTRRVPGWIALTEAIRALGKVGELAAAEEIVQDVMSEERAVDRLRKGKGQKWFWDTARAMGFGDNLDTSASSPKRSDEAGDVNGRPSPSAPATFESLSKATN